MGELPVFQLGALLAKDYPVRFLPCPARGTWSFIPWGGWMHMLVQPGSGGNCWTERLRSVFFF